MRNKFLNIASLKFLYRMARMNIKRKAKPLSRPMTDVEWELAQSQLEEIKLEQGLKTF